MEAVPYSVCGCPPPYAAVIEGGPDAPTICENCSQLPKTMLLDRIQKLERENAWLADRLRAAHALNRALEKQNALLQQENDVLGLFGECFKSAMRGATAGATTDKLKRELLEKLVLRMLNFLQEEGLLAKAQAQWAADPEFPKAVLTAATRRQLQGGPSA